MWDNARLLNAAADMLYLAAAALALWVAAQAAVRVPFVPVRSVVVLGEPRHLDADAVGAALEGRVAGNFFGIELEQVRRELQRLPWVRRVELRREWPDRILVRFEEHRALARWSDRWLVNTLGELFEAETDADLPQLRGPPGSEREVARRYLALRELLAPLEAEPTHVLLSARYAWRVRLASGVTLELGRDQARHSLEERVARFVAVYPRTAAQLNARIDHVDLRYPNGFAIRLHERLPETPAAGAPARRPT